LILKFGLKNLWDPLIKKPQALSKINNYLC